MRPGTRPRGASSPDTASDAPPNRDAVERALRAIVEQLRPKDGTRNEDEG